jgi:hypothetical protein
LFGFCWLRRRFLPRPLKSKRLFPESKLQDYE